MKITIVGAGHVGFSLGIVLSQNNKIVFLDNNEEKIKLINSHNSPIEENDLIQFIHDNDLTYTATSNSNLAIKDSKYIIICLPTDYSQEKKAFDTKAIDDIIQKVIEVNNKAIIIIKSTIPIGYVKKLRNEYNYQHIFFIPEFIREGNTLNDQLNPFRIIVGSKENEAKNFIKIYKKCIKNKDVIIKYVSEDEAETIKLFSNAYLGLRVSFFNEIDSFAEDNNLNSKEIIDGICLDPRIGNYYNNPSFGYGGYCLPKDIRQIVSMDNTKPVMNAILSSNKYRKEYIAKKILKMNPKTVGVYRIIMKKNASNSKNSAVIDIVNILKDKGVNIMIYEPTIKVNTFLGFEIVHDLKLFKELSNIIITNRYDEQLADVTDKLYTRDIFKRD